MKLLIFDIDGTITKTNPVDQECFRRTSESIFKQEIEQIDFHEFRNITDSAVVFELYQKYLDRNPSREEYFEFRKLFKKNLKALFRSEADGFEAVDGIQTLLRDLSEHDKWTFTIATGCWKFSAKFKLESSGFYVKDLDIVTADDGLTRDRIILNAIEQTTKKNKGIPFKRIVYVGDAAWDITSCYNLKIPFIGIDAEENEKNKGVLGNFFTLRKYPSIKKFLKIAKEAEVPSQPFANPLFRASEKEAK